MQQNGKKQEFDLVIGQVTQINEQDSTDKNGRPTGEKVLWITVAGAVRMMAQRATLNEFPGVGEVAAFQVASSRSGKMAMVQSWGWPDAKEKGAIVEGNVIYSLQWMASQHTVNYAIGQRRGA